MPDARSPTSWYPRALQQRLTSDYRQRSWLNTVQSLTKRIRQHCPQMQVKVLFQGIDKIYIDEALQLRLPLNQRVWVREVLLQCEQDNWVFARTVIPHFSVGNPWRILQTLGTQPLGEVLFELPQIKRSAFHFQSYPLARLPFVSQQRQARRSAFFYPQHPRYPRPLTEVFIRPLP